MAYHPICRLGFHRWSPWVEDPKKFRGAKRHCQQCGQGQQRIRK